MKAIDLVNFAAACTGMVIILLGLFFTLAVPYLETWTRRFFLILFSVAAAYVFSDLLSQVSLLFLGPDSSTLSRIAIFGESFFSSLLMPMMTLYLLRCSGERRKWTPLLASMITLWLVYAALLVFTQFTTEIYTISPDNVYHRGPLYSVLLAPPAAMMGLNCVSLFFRRKRLSKKQRAAFAVYLLVPFCCMLIQMVSYGFLMIVIGTSASVMILFAFILLDQVEHSIRQRQENAAQQVSITVLQMRPHFIYNTMMSIYYLCRQDTEKAQQVILDFTSYLRQNFTAIAKEETIPFPEEVEHTRAYLAVEQARFQDRLLVEFDTSFTAFRLPPLTLQPIVENAVKHGLDPELEQLFISVRSRQKDGYAEIIVEDSGPGFKPSDDDAPHIALSNIRERLKMMCGGEMAISSRDCGGTAITILIPVQPGTPAES
ncbi:MAG: histidine kinase [Clostridia bacterium]|nr:histidine kinase [Clostridia bacterium]